MWSTNRFVRGAARNKHTLLLFWEHPKNTFPVRAQNYWQTIPFPVSLQFKCVLQKKHAHPHINPMRTGGGYQKEEETEITLAGRRWYRVGRGQQLPTPTLTSYHILSSFDAVVYKYTYPVYQLTRLFLALHYLFIWTINGFRIIFWLFWIP